MLVTLEGRMIFRKFLQNEKALFPMFVILEGKVISRKLLQHQKA